LLSLSTDVGARLDSWNEACSLQSCKFGNGRRRRYGTAALSEILRGLEGKWVALRGSEVIAAADSADALFKRLRSKQIRDAAMLRVPTEQEHKAELVGLG
jgi:hypothetical protein